jgi:FlaA1/EpsC-like NDP-sugar epimerase
LSEVIAYPLNQCLTATPSDNTIASRDPYIWHQHMNRPQLRSIELRGRHLLALDLAATCISYVASLGLRFDAPSEAFDFYFRAYAWVIPLLMLCRVATFIWLRLYQRSWRYASVEELVSVVAAVVASSAIAYSVVFGVVIWAGSPLGFPRTVPVIDTILMIALSGGWRFALRVIGAGRVGSSNGVGDRVLIVGGGSAALAVIRELKSNQELGLVPIGLLADDVPRSQRLMGVPVLGDTTVIAPTVKAQTISTVLLALPTADGRTIRRFVNDADAAGARCLTVPSIAEVLAGRVTMNTLREIQVEDLLRRAPARIDLQSVSKSFAEQCILVTGAGGSIGGELARQLHQFGPRKLLLLGRGENSIFETIQSLDSIKRRQPTLHVEVVPLVHDIRDRARLSSLMAEHRPDVVFHAAAHKHVPFMEMFPEEAVDTNVLGTVNLVDACTHEDVQRFIFVSTDKAVNPSSIMGATKRIGELIVEATARSTGKRYASVRFGNVLSSRGSVVPTFRRQLEQGGPITVTHPDATRFFMTIPEAVQLVLQASAITGPGDKFVLDMGNPVRIVDLAHDLIRLHGLDPAQIEIRFVGVRPGEKLVEELFLADERAEPTENEAILRITASTPPSDTLRERVLELVDLAKRGDRFGIVRVLSQIVPEYQPPVSMERSPLRYEA